MLNNVGTKIIETERLILRPFTPDDAESSYKNWASDPSVQIPLAEPVYESVDAVRALMQKYVDGYSQGKYRWAIVLKDTEELIGLIAYFLVDEKNNFAEIEYGIGKAWWGKGLTTEATKAVIDFGFKEMNLHKVQISFKEYNKASKRIIEKCGLIFEGNMRDYFLEEGGYVSRLFYSILEDEYKA